MKIYSSTNISILDHEFQNLQNNLQVVESDSLEEIGLVEDLLDFLDKLPVNVMILNSNRYGYLGWKKVSNYIWREVAAGLDAEGATHPFRPVSEDYVLETLLTNIQDYELQYEVKF